jgi:CDP-diacylglycerol--glycerol-3-phosphate 3-phosphatidyltransferase
MLLTPMLVLLVSSDDLAWGALLLWLALIASDGVDGWLARRQGPTRSGAFLDPLADKVVVLAAMAVLVAQGLMWWLPLALIALREVVISTYRAHAARQGVSVPARGWAKIKAVAQYVAVGLAVIPIDANAYRSVLVSGAVWLAVGLTLATGAEYLASARRAPVLP